VVAGAGAAVAVLVPGDEDNRFALPGRAAGHWPAILPPLIVLSRLSLARSADNASARFILQIRPSESMSHVLGRPTTQWRGMETREGFKQQVAHERGLAVRLSVASEWLEETQRERVWAMLKSMRRGGPSFRSRPPRVSARVGSTSSSEWVRGHWGPVRRRQGRDVRIRYSTIGADPSLTSGGLSSGKLLR
jgi:hypothetical protein